jgi:hypothetical protein
MNHKLPLWLCIITLMSACSRTEPTTDATDQPGAGIGVLIFGDSGYHLDYPDQDDFVEMLTAEAYLEIEYNDWLEDKRPLDEFEARPSAISPVTGRMVPATGMHQVSAAMKHYCSNLATCDFGVMLGDNIYPSGATLGADGKDDEQRFEDTLAEPFGNIVDVPDNYTTYVTLGNHDWETSREGGFAQIEYLKRTDGFTIDGPYYSAKPTAGDGDVELFIVDTSMILASVTVNEDFLNEDGSEALTGGIEEPDYNVEPMTDEERNMSAWLEDALKTSTAKWKFVIAHHPIWSSSGSKFEQARVLRELLLPPMCRYADAYIVGHDHTLEIHTDDCTAALGQATEVPLVQIVSGAAAKQRPIHTSFMWHQERKYPEHKTIWAAGLLWGFAHMQLEGDNAKVSILSVPDDGSADISTDFEYEFGRRSHLNYGKL